MPKSPKNAVFTMILTKKHGTQPKMLWCSYVDTQDVDIFLKTVYLVETWRNFGFTLDFLPES